MERDNQTEIIRLYLSVRKTICEAIMIMREYLRTTSNNRAAMLELEDRMYKKLKELDEDTYVKLVTSMSNINTST